MIGKKVPCRVERNGKSRVVLVPWTYAIVGAYIKIKSFSDSAFVSGWKVVETDVEGHSPTCTVRGM